MQLQKTAVVIGGGIAGLMAARVCCDHFTRVEIVERDVYPEEVEPRKGIPQGRHLHVLLARGKEILETLFPGFRKALLDAGGLELRQTTDMLLFDKFGRWKDRRHTESTSLNATRPLIEHIIRTHLRTLEQIHFHPRHEVTGLLWNEEQTSVEGVHIRPRQEYEVTSQQTLHADLVIDASGTHSHLPDWLDEAGYERPQETTVNAFTGYASRLYEIPEDFKDTWKWMLIWNQPPNNPRSGHIFRVEKDRWLVSLMGMCKEYPPTHEEDFLEFARKLSHPVLYETIRDAKPLSPISGYRDTQNRLRHYEKLTRWPQQLMALGNSVCVFNPSYGQGMTVSAQGALLLQKSLQEAQGHYATQCHVFQKRLAKQNQGPWMMATGEEVRWPETEGASANFGTRIRHAYIDKVSWLGSKSEFISRYHREVVNLQRSPGSLFHPLIFLAVCFWPRWKSKASSTPLPPPKVRD